MNPTSDSPDRDHRLRETLAASATGLDVDVVAPDEIESSGRRRRRHRRLVGGSAVLALAVGAVVVIATGSDDSTISTSDTAPPVSTVPASATTVPATTPALPTTLPPTTPPTTAATPTTASTATGGPQPPTDTYGGLVPFGDGFAMVTPRIVSPPLPERLPPEVRDLFSPEAIELFSDGLPPTVDEAIEVLQEAGLLEEVTEVITNHPDAYDAIYGSGPETRTTDVWTTLDGATWTRNEVLDGLAYPASSAAADGLTLWTTQPDPNHSSTTVRVATSSDLASWRSVEFALGTNPDLPTYVTESGWVESITVVGDRWFALATVTHDIDWMTLLPPEVQADLGDRAFGLSYGDGELTVDYVTGDGLTVRSFGFDELGLPPDPLAGLDQSLRQQLLTGVFSDQAPPERLVVPSAPGSANQHALLALQSGELIYVGDAVYRSTDGRSWREAARLPDDVIVTGAAPLDDQVVLVGQGQGSRPTVLRWHPDDGLVEGRTPDLPRGASLWGNPASPAWVVDAFPTATPTPIEFGFEYDGLQYLVVDDQQTLTLRVIDQATGELVADRTFQSEARTELFATFGGEQQGVVPIADDDGNEIGQVPSALVVNAYLDAQSATAPPVDPKPDRWLIATSDGETWTTVDLADPDDDMAWTATAAVNGDRLLVLDEGTWTVTTIP